MYCIKCGHEMEENAKICSNCGYDMDSRGMESKQDSPSNSVIATKKDKNGLVVVISVAAALVVLISIFLYMITFGGYDSIRVSRLCDLGDRYLSELDYEQAIAAYEAAIDIDPKCEEAYLGLADIYIEQGNYEEAVEILEVGSNQTESRIISRKLEEAEELLAERKRDENQFGNDSMQTEESQPEEPLVPEPEGLTAREYLESDLIPAMGLLDVGQVYKAGYTEEYHDDYDYDYYVLINMYVQGISGIAGYDIRDYDKDGEDELLVLILKEGTEQTTGDSYHTVWMQMYERDTAGFNLTAETEAKRGRLGGVDFQHLIFYIKETDSAVYVAEEYKEGYGGIYADGTIEGLYILHYTGSEFVADLEEEFIGSSFFGMEEETAAIAADLKNLGFTESAASLPEEMELNEEMKLNEADGLDAVFLVDGGWEDASINQYMETQDISVLEVVYRFYRNVLD